MKKIILLMLLAFSSTTLVHATLLDDKIAAYKNIYNETSKNYCSDEPNSDLHIILQQQSKAIYNEIEIICENAHKTYLNDLKNNINNHANQNL
ncbi:MAG: hypothetical protein Q8K37_04565, partial [Alphaproteobacteria bacterium]|nr:hypothetical protein [Alphaproteobacteria bacterium]